MTTTTITDEDALYYARAWRKSRGLDKRIRDSLYAWVRANLPSRVPSVLSEQLSGEEVDRT